ncbi:hypothetical protein [Acinetobacter gandensis]|uniref:hypothetical protein n=1 Tax=Acinetobacter gandensis TaxID=1443941 RepID=UPI003F57A285
MTATAHEVVRLFQDHAYPLSEKLTEMLNEHYSHQTERRGCGYTQATRVLAEYINVPRVSHEFQDLKLFDQYDTHGLRKILDQSRAYHVDLSSWRNLDLNQNIQQLNQSEQATEFCDVLEKELRLQKSLRQIQQHANLEESQLICALIEDVILPKSPIENQIVEVQALVDKPKVGSCPMAENFFFKIAHRRVLRNGEINIFVDVHGQPIFMEKLNMGDNHSCISLKPVLMNGVRIPAGSLFSVSYDAEQLVEKRQNREFKGFVIPYQAISGWWFLRLTTLAVSPQNRKRAFSTHFQQQVDNGLYSPGTTELQQLIDVAIAQL